MPSNTTNAHTSLGYSTLTKPGCLVFAVLGVCSHSSDSHCQSHNSQPILDKMKAFIEVYLFIFIDCWLHFLVVTCLQGNFCEWFYRNWQCWFSLLLLLQQETHCMCQGFSPSLWYLAHHGSVQCCYCFFFFFFFFFVGCTVIEEHRTVAPSINSLLVSYPSQAFWRWIRWQSELRTLPLCSPSQPCSRCQACGCPAVWS